MARSGYYYRGDLRNYYYDKKRNELYHYELFPDGYEGDVAATIGIYPDLSFETFIRICEEYEANHEKVLW